MSFEDLAGVDGWVQLKPLDLAIGMQRLRV